MIPGNNYARTVAELVNPNVKGAKRRKIWKLEIVEGESEVRNWERQVGLTPP